MRLPCRNVLRIREDFLMAKCELHDNVVAGFFKIRGKDTNTVLVYVTQWKKGPEGSKFIHLSVRECKDKMDGDSVVAIQFEYELGCIGMDVKTARELHDKFLDQYTHLLRVRFGNGLVDTDISTQLYVIVD
jgi:hypothetical protein